MHDLEPGRRSDWPRSLSHPSFSFGRITEFEARNSCYFSSVTKKVYGLRNASCIERDLSTDRGRIHSVEASKTTASRGIPDTASRLSEVQTRYFWCLDNARDVSRNIKGTQSQILSFLSKSDRARIVGTREKFFRATKEICHNWQSLRTTKHMMLRKKFDATKKICRWKKSWRAAKRITRQTISRHECFFQHERFFSRREKFCKLKDEWAKDDDTWAKDDDWTIDF